MLDLPALMLAPLRKPIGEPALGAGQPVLVLPGYMADDRATSLLRRSLDHAGLRSHGWTLGINRGEPDNLTKLEARLEQIAARHGQPVVLVGWSLGGVYARELSARRPAAVRMAISLGSPFAGRIRMYSFLQRFAGADFENMAVRIGGQAKPPVPTIALWSKRDGLVPPGIARGGADQSDEQIELDVTHMGFVSSAQGIGSVVRLIAQRLRDEAIRV